MVWVVCSTVVEAICPAEAAAFVPAVATLVPSWAACVLSFWALYAEDRCEMIRNSTRMKPATPPAIASFQGRGMVIN